MPATRDVILNRQERWFLRARSLCITGLIGGIFFLGMSLIPGFYVGIGFWMYLEQTAANDPLACFDQMRGCEVLDVSYRYVSKICADVFTYEWKLPGSPVVFQQKERIQRSGSLCLADLNISAADATFQVGLSSCFKLKELFSGYADNGAFNCATVLRLNNSIAGPCQTLIEPVSNYDPMLSLAMQMTLLGLVTLGLCSLCPCDQE